MLWIFFYIFIYIYFFFIFFIFFWGGGRFGGGKGSGEGWHDTTTSLLSWSGQEARVVLCARLRKTWPNQHVSVTFASTIAFNPPNCFQYLREHNTFGCTKWVGCIRIQCMNLAFMLRFYLKLWRYIIKRSLLQGIDMLIVFKLLIYYSSVIIVLILFCRNCTVLYHISKLVWIFFSLLLPTLNHTLICRLCFILINRDNF